MYLAVGLTAGGHNHDTGELLEVFKLPFEGCMLMAQRGELLIVKPWSLCFTRKGI